MFLSFSAQQRHTLHIQLSCSHGFNRYRKFSIAKLIRFEFNYSLGSDDWGKKRPFDAKQILTNARSHVTFVASSISRMFCWPDKNGRADLVQLVRRVITNHRNETRCPAHAGLMLAYFLCDLQAHINLRVARLVIHLKKMWSFSSWRNSFENW